MSGLTYNGKTESGEARWDALKNCKLTIHETTITLQVSNDLNRHLFIYLPHLPWNISILMMTRKSLPPAMVNGYGQEALLESVGHHALNRNNDSYLLY